MIVNKKGRMAITVVALTILLPLPSVFAASQPSGWRHTWNALTSPFALQTTGILGSLAAANYLHHDTALAIPATASLILPLLASYLRHKQRLYQKPEERSTLGHIINPMAANAAGLLAYYALQGGGGSNWPTVLALATALGACFGSTSGYAWSFDEELEDARKNLEISVQNNTEIAKAKTDYEEKRARMPRPDDYPTADTLEVKYQNKSNS